MIERIRSSLSIKVFLMTAALTAVCCLMTYFCIVQFAPYIYRHDLSVVEEELPYFVEELSHFPKEEALWAIEDYSHSVIEQNDGEFVFHLFPSGSEEMKRFDQKDTSRWYRLTFEDSAEEYTVFFSKNTEKESQVVEALEKALPILSVMILAVSLIAAFFYTLYMTAPMKRISKISKQMAALDFSGLCPVRRSDEIGVLAASLNNLSEKLSAALSELRSANSQLRADIDKERELERQRMDFFSAASHELKTPITIIKGQLQGMLCQVGRYKDRDAYLAESLAVIGTLERMVGELLTISRLDASDYVCKKADLDLSALVGECLSAHEDLFLQRELAVEKWISPEIWVSGDRRLLQKALDSLLSNAAAYSPAGNRVIVKLWRDGEKGRLTIENTGVRIPSQALPKLFEAFYRVDPSRNRQTGGTGLGLYIARTILDLHGAAIGIENTAQGVMASVVF